MTDSVYNKLWQTKLDARLHDPGEKALILMRTRAGHEGGTVRALREALKLQSVDESAVKRADWWASAADRPQWPRDFSDRVHWTREPVLIHPISGEQIDLREQGRLQEIKPDTIAERSLAHFERLREACGNDPRKTLLAFWRFGPELTEADDDDDKLGALWGQLPADSRVPDHSIWEHLDLVSAFAGAFAGDENGEAALLAVSIGPVQPFIAAARSTSDLWAGSHLLARLAWETMKPLVEELGPDAVLFPRLRGIPQVDLWLCEQGLPEDLFTGAAWRQSANADANPLFAAALPNRFVALVPASRARELAERCREAVRGWMQQTGRQVVERLLEEVGEAKDEALYCFEQARRQLEGFPEVHWAAVPFSLIGTTSDGKQVTDTARLSEVMAPFFGTAPGEPAGFLASEAWQVLQRSIDWQDGTAFWAPNPGVLYPAVYELAERVLAAAKSVRPFEQTAEQGWRDSLSGEAEWLTTDRSQLDLPPGQRSDTLWTRIAVKRPAWAKQGEHLGALSAIKRLWPTLFAEEAGRTTGRNFGRFVVSTHTMALAHQIDRWLEHGGLTADGFSGEREKLQRDRVALPARVVLRHRDNPALEDARTLPALMEQAQETESDAEAERLRRVVRDTLKRGLKEEADFRIETYYGLIMMDGDRMGALLAEGGGVTFGDSFHPAIRSQFDQRAAGNERLKRYAETSRPPSPGRHMVISSALNDFALQVVPHIVQREYLGRVIYGGGDDVMAMLPVADLMPAAARLRDAWSGQTRFAPEDEQDEQRQRLKLEKGHALLDGRLLRMMGERATASAGLVVAHHQTPLSRVLRELRAAEQGAKQEGGRDALQIRVLKRSGGALQLTLKWTQLGVFQRLLDFLREPSVSRRAVYHCLQWLRDLPEPNNDTTMLASLLGYQLRRQAGKKAIADHHNVEGLAADIADLAVGQEQPRDWTGNFLSVAEFLARETRAGGHDGRKNETTAGEAA